MLLHIALVSLTREVSLAQLSPVSDAIQKQISRDFDPKLIIGHGIRPPLHAARSTFASRPAPVLWKTEARPRRRRWVCVVRTRSGQLADLTEAAARVSAQRRRGTQDRPQSRSSIARVRKPWAAAGTACPRCRGCRPKSNYRVRRRLRPELALRAPPGCSSQPA